ncbi:MAG TPA: response regulator [Myxococcota bacterium]|jgi:DNA-binding response OmpR family regulator|nr:response regulator [Myxococcota bacterium]
MSAARILVVDDSLTVRMDLAEMFGAAGLNVVLCATAAEARAAAADAAVDLLVLDVVLPDGDGLDLLQELRRTPHAAGTPVLLLSSEGEVRDRARGLATGADDYVGKPYDRGYVLARARELLRRGDTRPEAAGGRILLIDDSLTFREELGAGLRASGYQVVAAASGEEGLRLAAHERPAAVLVDGVMPGIDGATVIRRLRLDAALRGTPCVLLTGSDDPGAELRALDAGADAFVRKDEVLAVILARLEAVLRNASGAAASQPTASLQGPKRILAVDDSPTYLHELGDALRADGYDVVLAASGEEALELLAVQPVDCILLDLVMPGLGGQETCRRIKATAAFRNVPLIMLTALEEAEAMIQGLRAGADDYIAKSSDVTVVKARVLAQLRRRQFEDETRRIREQLLQAELEAAGARAARQVAETRAALVEELEVKNRELEAFSYSVSHDLHAPLRVIDGFSEMLLEEHAAGLNDGGRRCLEQVRASARRMRGLIDDLLALSRIGRAALRRETVDLTAVARSVEAELRAAQPDRLVRVLVEAGLHADADPGLLYALLQNLMGNAWKFTGRSGEPVIEMGAAREVGAHAYFVRDNGVGFDEAYADKLFGPFQRLHSKDEFPGTGIGLATVRRIVDRHGGRVWAAGAVGRGATVYWTLPPKEVR